MRLREAKGEKRLEARSKEGERKREEVKGQRREANR
jgi:hypothetical protein